MKLLLRIAAVLAAAWTAEAAAAVELGVMGDSLSDEYAEESYGAYAQNWVEQLVLHAGVYVGQTAVDAGQPGGSWGEPRRTGYRYNWARSGATTGTLLTGGQHTGLAAEVVSEGIGYAVLFIGANDFIPTGTAYQSIYFGLWSGATIDAYVAQRVANLDAALDTVLPTGVQLVLVTVPDYGLAPATQTFYTDPAKRQLVGDVIAQLNAQIDAIAQVRQLPLVDFYAASLAIFGPHGSPNSTLLIGNVAIQLAQSDTPGGANPTAAFVHDGVHPNTTLQGVLANTFLEALNIAYGADLTLFTEQQILEHRGLSYGGSDTLVAQIGPYSDYITNYASSPVSVPALASGGLVPLFALIAAAGRRLRMRRSPADAAAARSPGSARSCAP